jgi:hypothetical protein
MNQKSGRACDKLGHFFQNGCSFLAGSPLFRRLRRLYLRSPAASPSFARYPPDHLMTPTRIVIKVTLSVCIDPKCKEIYPAVARIKNQAARVAVTLPLIGVRSCLAHTDQTLSSIQKTFLAKPWKYLYLVNKSGWF